MDVCFCDGRNPGKKKEGAMGCIAGLPATQSFLGHLLHFLQNRFKDLSLLETGRHVTVVKRPEKWRGRFHGLT